MRKINIFVAILLFFPVLVFGQGTYEKAYGDNIARSFYKKGEKYYSGKKQDYIKAAK